ncbi:MAG: sulfotransferase [Bacteroidota bacterium]
MTRPFVYIAGGIRTGSTLLSEALSAPETALILREPRLGANRIVLREGDRDELSRLGIEADRVLTAPRRRLRVLRAMGKGGHPSGGAGRGRLSGYAARAFRDRIVRPLSGRVLQVGIKEVRHDGWEHVVAAFPGLACVAIARDPRDVFLSHRARVIRRANTPPTPADFAAEFNRQFELQRALIRATGALRVRYEDLCTVPAVLGRVRAHVESPVTGTGSVGAFLATQPMRRTEAERHGGTITDQRVARWTREPDAMARRAASDVFDRLGAYAAFWGYHADGRAPLAP